MVRRRRPAFFGEAQFTDPGVPGFRYHFDAATDLPDGYAFINELSGRLARWKPHRSPPAVALLKVNDFKAFKSQFGEPAADAILRALTRAISAHRPRYLARSGEDTFALISENESFADIDAEVRRLPLDLPRHRIPVQGSLFHATLTAGVAEATVGETALELISRAGAALDVATVEGQHCAYIHDGSTCVPLDPDHCARDERGRERRSCLRYPFQFDQLVGPYVAGRMPTWDELYAVACHDISVAGFSFRTREPPPFKSLILVLDFVAHRKHLVAEVVRCERVFGDAQSVFHVGCKFIGCVWPRYADCT